MFAPVSHVNQKATVCASEKGLARDDSAGLGMIRSSTRFHPTPGRSCRLSLNRTLAISREMLKRNFRGSHEFAAHVHDGRLTLCSFSSFTSHEDSQHVLFSGMSNLTHFRRPRSTRRLQGLGPVEWAYFVHLHAKDCMSTRFWITWVLAIMLQFFESGGTTG